MEQINLNKNVTIEFTPEQIGYVLNVLREQPYKHSVDLIALIQQTVIEQVKEKPVINQNGIKPTEVLK